MNAPVADAPRRYRAAWNFAVEREHNIPHQIALPDLDEDDVRLALHYAANRVIAEGNDRVRLERLLPGREVRIALFDLPTMRWRAFGGDEEGQGIPEVTAWLGRQTLMGAVAALHGVLRLRGRC